MHLELGAVEEEKGLLLHALAAPGGVRHEAARERRLQPDGALRPDLADGGHAVVVVHGLQLVIGRLEIEAHEAGSAVSPAAHDGRLGRLQLARAGTTWVYDRALVE